MYKILFILIFSTFILAMATSAPANTAQFVSNSSTVVLHQYGTANTTYTVELISGISGYSKINLTNIKVLNSHGITASLTNMSGIPPFSGKLVVSAGQNTYPMMYNLSIIVLGNDTQATPTTLYINVIKYNNSIISSNNITPPNISNNYIPIPPTPRLLKISEINNSVDGANGARLNFGNVTVLIPPNTYVSIGNKSYLNYNFSIILFKPQNMSIAPLPYNISYAYGFAVNGQITPSIKFTTANGNIRNITTILKGNNTYTAMPFGGGSYNSIAYNFGNYNSYMNWTFNSENNTIQNNTNYPGAWVVFHAPFEIYYNHGVIDTGFPPQNITSNILPSNVLIPKTSNGAVTTTVLPTTNVNNTYSKSNILSYLTYIALVIVVIAILFLIYKKIKR
ncbi:MAG: hypothetical protein M1385_01465 [Candidatus Marsarchaeota archaeon]|nr:hypothetical protein [Candidatus Marsarchaeota archaeon]